MSERMLVATRKGLLQLARKNGGWSIARLSFPGVAVTAALHDARDGTLYAMLKHGHFGSKLHRSDDDGQTWTELPAPAFPADAAGAPTLFQIWTLEAGGADEPGRLWAGALPAGLFRSDDRGEHWQQVSALWNVPEREKWFGGGYDDAGIHIDLARSARPEPACSSPSPAAACGIRPTPAKAGRCAATGWSRPICRRNWPGRRRRRTRIAWRAAPPRPTRCGCSIIAAFSARPMPAPPGRRSNCRWTISASPSPPIRSDPLTAWFVPAIKDELRVPRDGALAVTRTRDGGKTWESFRDGLPQRDAFDLIYRHGLDVDATGTRLAMGSTTGSLWVSDNAGEGWQLVNAHLPPIYAVRLY